MDAEMHLAYNVSETLTVFGNYSRRAGFAGGTAAYQIVDTLSAVLEYSPREDLKLRARFQHDRTHDSNGDRRSWVSTTVGPEYHLLEHLILEAHATYRRGRIPDSAGDEKFGDAILSAGIIASF